MGAKARNYTLANALVSQALEGTALQDYISRKSDKVLKNQNIGCIISNQYGHQTSTYVEHPEHLKESVMNTPQSKKPDRLRIIREMPHILPSTISLIYGLNGVVAAPSMSAGGGMVALGQAYRLLKSGA